MSISSVRRAVQAALFRRVYVYDGSHLVAVTRQFRPFPLQSHKAAGRFTVSTTPIKFD